MGKFYYLCKVEMNPVGKNEDAYDLFAHLVFLFLIF